VAPFTARLTNNGWHVECGQQNTTAVTLRDYLRLAASSAEAEVELLQSRRRASTKAEGLSLGRSVETSEIEKRSDGFFGLAGGDDNSPTR